MMLAAVYFAAGKASFNVSVSHDIVTLVVFAAEGFALAAVILLGWQMWPGVFLGQLTLALSNGLGPELALGIAAINSLEAVVAAGLFSKLKLHTSLDRLRDALILVLLIFLVLQPLSATLGVSLLWYAGKVPESGYATAWFSWWFGNSMGQLLVTPMLLSLFGAHPRMRLTPAQAVVIVALLTPASLIFFSSANAGGAALAFAVFMPLLILVGMWGAMAAATLSSCAIAVMALIGTSQGVGPFANDSGAQLLDLNLFLLGSALTAQFIAALFHERRHASELLQRHADIVDKYVITSSTDPSGVITSASQAFIDISGFSRAELIGKSHNIVRHPDMPGTLYRQMWETISKGQPWNGEIKNRAKDGRYYWVGVNIEPTFDPDGAITGYTAIRQDITDKKRIEVLSVTDRLTQLFNRMKLDETLQQEYERAARYGSPLSLIMLDIDYFKSVNDTYGHQVGDQVLIRVASLLRANVREVDIPGRWGGEEFLVICPETDHEGALVLAENLRKAFADHEFPVVGQKTCSFGVATRLPDEMTDSMIHRADLALYQAKKKGRNQVEAAAR